MSIKIRLKRMGKRNTPFYRLVVVDSRWRRDGKTIADIGWYDPVKAPAQKNIKEIEVYHWLENGAQVSDTARSLLKQEGIWDRFRSGEYKQLVEEQKAAAAEKRTASSGVVSKISQAASAAGHTAVDAASAAGHTVADVASAAGHTVADVASAAGHTVADAASAVSHTVTDVLSSVVSKVRGSGESSEEADIADNTEETDKIEETDKTEESENK